jgi:hypothetical protein
MKELLKDTSEFKATFANPNRAKFADALVAPLVIGNWDAEVGHYAPDVAHQAFNRKLDRLARQFEQQDSDIFQDRNAGAQSLLRNMPLKNPTRSSQVASAFNLTKQCGEFMWELDAFFGSCKFSPEMRDCFRGLLAVNCAQMELIRNLLQNSTTSSNALGSVKAAHLAVYKHIKFPNIANMETWDVPGTRTFDRDRDQFKPLASNRPPRDVPAVDSVGNTRFVERGEQRTIKRHRGDL